MKDELNGCVMDELVGLKAKMYSFSVAGKEEKKSKGVKKCVIKKKVIHHSDFKEALFNNVTKYTDMTSIPSYKHKLYTITQNKKSLSAFDDKRFILANRISTLPHGHKNILYRN